jgi:hypothetical protein
MLEVPFDELFIELYSGVEIQMIEIFIDNEILDISLFAVSDELIRIVAAS